MTFQHLPRLGILLLASIIAVSGNTVKITEGVYTFNLGGGPVPYTSLFVVTGAGVMVIDPMNTVNAKEMLKEIRKVTSEPITYVFYSHDHWDHASGAQVFQNEGDMIIAHKDANDWIKSHTGTDQIPADLIWWGENVEYTLGRFTMQLHNFGPSHGNGMTIFVVNSTPRVAYIADIAQIKSTGALYLPGYDTKGWENTLEKALNLDVQRIVFTHSPPEGGVKQDLADHLGFIKDVRAGVKAELAKGTNPFLIPSVLKLDKYKDWNGYTTQFGINQFTQNVLHFAVEEALGPYALQADQEKTEYRKIKRWGRK